MGNLETNESKNQQLKDDETQLNEELKEDNSEMIINQINQGQNAMNSSEMVLEPPTENSGITMETSETEELDTKNQMVKNSPPSLTQSTLDNDALEDLFQDKSLDTATEDAIVKELPL